VSFHVRRASAVFWKEMLDLRKNKALVLSMMVLPLILVLVPAGIVYSYARAPDDPSLRTMALFYEAGLPREVSSARFLIDRILTDWFGLFLMMPVFVPILISSQSVAGEKERRTIEPLLASPVTPAELLAGKSLAAMAPAVAITFGAFALFCVAVDVAAWPLVKAPLLPNGLWVFGVFVRGSRSSSRRWSPCRCWGWWGPSWWECCGRGPGSMRCRRWSCSRWICCWWSWASGSSTGSG
jgi:ABC-2 type transport system permease protein